MRTMFVLPLLLALVLAAACTPKASPQECQTACAKKVAFERARAPEPKDDAAIRIQQDFAQKAAAFEKEKQLFLEPILNEKTKKLAAAKKDADKEKIESEYKAKADKKLAELQPKIEQLNQERIKAEQAIREARKSTEQARKAAEEKNARECAESCQKSGLSKAKVECQIKSGSLDDFAKCKD